MIAKNIKEMYPALTNEEIAHKLDITPDGLRKICAGDRASGVARIKVSLSPDLFRYAMDRAIADGETLPIVIEQIVSEHKSKV